MQEIREIQEPSSATAQDAALETRKRQYLRTERLILRPFAASDWEAVNTFLSDPEVTRWMHFSRYSEADRRRWFDWCLQNNEDAGRDADNWAILLAHADSEVIGWLGIGASSSPSVPGERSFGYALARAQWGRGSMTEALRAVLDHEFSCRRVPRITATVETENVASARVMEKVGMTRVKTVYDQDFEGNWAMRHHYAIEHPEAVAR